MEVSPNWNDGVARMTTAEVNEFARGASARIAELGAALNGMVRMYVELVDSGDAGFWDAEKVPEVIAARAALAKVSQQSRPKQDSGTGAK